MDEQGSVRQAVILFVDVSGSVSLSNALPPEAYDKTILKPLHATYASVLKSYRIGRPEGRSGEQVVEHTWIDNSMYTDGTCEYSIAGDQLFVCLFSDNQDFDVVCGICMAVETMVRWLEREPNLSRHHVGQPPIRLFAGLHFGPVWVRKRPESLRDGIHAEGLGINVAKRVEGCAREGDYTGIFVTDVFRDELLRRAQEVKVKWNGLQARPFYSFANRSTRDLKGLGPISTYELKCCIPHAMVITPARYSGRGVADALRRNPYDFVTLSSLAVYLMHQGQQAEAQQVVSSMDRVAAGDGESERFLADFKRQLGLED